MMGSQPAGDTTTTSNTSPWSGVQPYISGMDSGTGAQFGAPGGATTQGLAGLLPSAAALYGDTSAWPQYFPSSTYAPMGTEQSDLINQITGQGMAGGDASLQNANSTLSGMLSLGGTAATSPAFADTQNYIDSAVNGGQGVNQTSGAYGQDLGYLGSMMGGAGVAQSQPAYNNSLDYLSSAASGNQGVNQTAPVYGQGMSYLSNQIGGQGVGQTQGAFNTAQNYLQGMAGGDTLNPFTSPGFQNVINGTLANVIPATSASFINGGRADSGLAEAAQTAAATNAIGSLANQNYTQEQGLQQGASGMASQNQLAQQQLQNSAEQQAQQAMLQQQGLQQGASGLGLQAQNQQQQLQANAASQAQNAMLAQQGLQQGAAGLGANDYLTQQGNQVKAAAVAPAVDQSQLGDLSTGLSAQGQAQQNQQNQINAAVQNWNYNQTLPYNMLGMYQGYTGGNYGGSSSVSTPYFQNQGSNILGGALGALGIGSSLVGGNGLLGSLAGGTGLFGGGSGADTLATLAAFPAITGF